MTRNGCQYFELELISTTNKTAFTSCGATRHYTHPISCTSSASPSPLPLTCLCPWDYPSAYVGIYRRVRQWSGSWVGVSAAIVLFQFPRGILVTMIYFLIIILPRWISWFADFTSFNLMSSSSILGCHSRVLFISYFCQWLYFSFVLL